VSQRYYPGDARLLTTIQALQDRGYQVDMVCMRSPGQPLHSYEDGVHIYRIPSMIRKRAGKLRYALEYLSFLVPCALLVLWLHLRKGYTVVEVTNLPDFLLAVGVLPRLLGAKLIFDVRECAPEMFNDRWGLSMDGRFMRLMIAIEQWCIRFAHATVTCTEQMRQAMIGRGADPDKIAVVLNVNVSANLTGDGLPDPNDTAADEFRIVTHGTIIKRYGHEVLIRAMPHIVAAIPQARLKIFGRGEMKAELESLVKTLELDQVVNFPGFVSEEELVRTLRAAHVGVVTLLRNPEADLVHTFKMFEYIALGVPVVHSGTTAAKAYFDPTCMQFFEASDEKDLARAVIELYQSPARRHDMAKNARQKVADSYSTARQKVIFGDVVDGLVSGFRRRAAQAYTGR
jgi:glycosyltransferase involved in cell wall biosynthesis